MCHFRVMLAKRFKMNYGELTPPFEIRAWMDKIKPNFLKGKKVFERMEWEKMGFQKGEERVFSLQFKNWWLQTKPKKIQRKSIKKKLTIFTVKYLYFEKKINKLCSLLISCVSLLAIIATNHLHCYFYRLCKKCKSPHNSFLSKNKTITYPFNHNNYYPYFSRIFSSLTAVWWWRLIFPVYCVFHIIQIFIFGKIREWMRW